MAQNSNLNSLLNAGISGDVPPAFKHPEVIAAVEMFITGLRNLTQDIERYTGITQKDPSLWSLLAPTDTLLRQNLGRIYVKASVNLVFGNMVNFHSVAGVLNARLANASSGVARRAHGYCNVAAGTLAGEITEVILTFGLLPISGIIPVNNLYLSTTPGTLSTTPATAAGELEQYCGYCVADDLAYISIVPGTFIQH